MIFWASVESSQLSLCFNLSLLSLHRPFASRSLSTQFRKFLMENLNDLRLFVAMVRYSHLFRVNFEAFFGLVCVVDRISLRHNSVFTFFWRRIECSSFIKSFLHRRFDALQKSLDFNFGWPSFGVCFVTYYLTSWNNHLVNIFPSLFWPHFYAESPEAHSVSWAFF